MRPRIIKTLTRAVPVLALALASCMSDVENPSFLGEGEGIPVVISFDPTVYGVPDTEFTRGYHDPGDPSELTPGGGLADGRAADIEIGDIRVLLYKSSTGVYIDQARAENIEEGVPVPLQLLTGTYDVVVIANGSSDTSQNGEGFLTQFFAPGNEAAYDLVGKVKNALIDARAFDAGKPIPMFAIERNVHFTLDGHVQSGGEDFDTLNDDPWTPVLKRAGVRLSLEITLTPWQYAEWAWSDGDETQKSIYISNIPTGTWLQEAKKPNGDSPGGREQTSRAYSATLVEDTATGPIENHDGYIKYFPVTEQERLDGGQDKYVVYYDRIILPELLFTDKIDSGKAMLLSMDPNNDPAVSGRISGPEPGTSEDGYKLPRNTWLHLDVSIAGGKLEVTPEVIPWNTVAGDGEFEDKFWIRAPSPLYLVGTGRGDDFVATTDHPSEDMEFIDEEGMRSGWITSIEYRSDATTGDNGVTSRTFAVEAEGLPNNVPRRGFFYLRSGDLIKKVVVIQYPSMVHAAPGMPGIKKSDYFWLLTQRERTGDPDWLDPDIKLTVRGSSLYRDQLDPETDAPYPFVTNSEFGELENEPVYVLYFMWGSMVALAGPLGQSWNNNGANVVWVNSEFTLPASGQWTRGRDNTFTIFPAPNDGVETKGESDFGLLDPTVGHGDVCLEATGGRWRLPTGGPWTSPMPYSGSTTPFSNSTAHWTSWEAARNHSAVTDWTDDIHIGISGTNGGTISDEGDLFLPAAGTYSNIVNSAGSEGYYWTSSWNSYGSGLGNSLYFNSGNLRSDMGWGFNYCNTVRCVALEAMD